MKLNYEDLVTKEYLPKYMLEVFPISCHYYHGGKSHTNCFSDKDPGMSLWCKYEEKKRQRMEISHLLPLLLQQQ